MGVPGMGLHDSMVLTPTAHHWLQEFHRQELNASARREQARRTGDNRGGHGRGRPKGAKNRITLDTLRERLAREQHPMLQMNVLQTMKAEATLPYDWNTSLSHLDPTQGFTRCSPLLPGNCVHCHARPST
jgi:hypothetical protein